MRRAAFGTVIVLAAAFVPMLSSTAAAILLASIVILWLVFRPEKGEIYLVVPLLAAAALWFVFDSATGHVAGPNRPDNAARVLGDWWQLQDDESQSASAALSKLSSFAELARESAADLSLRRDVFRFLEERARAAADERLTWLLLDPDGAVRAWAGLGLLHDFAPSGRPSVGRSFLSSFTAVSLLSTREVVAGLDVWHLVVGRSVAAERLPGEGSEAPVAHWTLVDRAQAEVASARTIEIDEGEVLLVVSDDLGSFTRPGHSGVGPTTLLGVAMMVLGLWRLGVGFPGPLRSHVPLIAGTVLLGVAGGLEPWIIALLALVLLAVLYARPTVLEDKRAWLTALVSLLVVAVLIGGAFLLQSLTGPTDLGKELIGSVYQVGLRLALFLAALALLRWTPHSATIGRPQAHWAWLTFAVIACGAAFHSLWWVGLISLLFAAFCAVAWIRSGVTTDHWTQSAVLWLVAAMLSALSWEIAFHEVLERDLEERVLPALAPPTFDELAETEWTMRRYFEDLELGRWALASLDRSQIRDLAFALWRESPLARGGAFSAVYVQPADAEASMFSFGLPLSEEGELDRTPPVWEEIALPGWDEALIGGESDLKVDGEVWGRVRYWKLLRPGFRWASSSVERITEGLLRGVPGASPQGLLPGDARFGLFASDGTVLVPPWKGAGDLDPLHLEARTTPNPDRASHAALAFVAAGPEGYRALFLPIPSPLSGLERVATHAVSPLLAVAALLAAALLVNIGRSTWREMLHRSWRSYSTRLLILYTAILIAPLILANVLLLRAISERLEREDRVAGEAALESAQRILGEYVLTLEPGFGVDTTLDDELLLWLSRVLHREVNLYWDSEVYASSKPELFAAGLLPTRVPGEILSRLTLEGADMASRTSRAGGATYQEFYAPVRAPGVASTFSNLLLSTPLLAQEVERQQEMSAIRRRAVLLTSTLAFLLVALGSRLARRFTDPLTSIVEGTERVAAGATSIGFTPAETELATIAGAIDEMAARIASGRQKLLSEKQVVDSVVENITSAVASVDRRGAVLLLNRNARALLGLEVGEPLIEQLQADPRFESLVSFLRRVERKPSRSTVLIRGGRGTGPEEAPESEREWTVIWVPLAGVEEPASILVIEDVTEVLRGQRLEAWAEMARMIAHEIKNPLTPIRLSTEHLREVYRKKPEELDEVFERCTDNILAQVEELQAISSEFSTYSRIPRADLRKGDLVEAVASVVGAYLSPPPEGVRIDWRCPQVPVVARFDEKLLGRAIRNLMENAIRAAAGGGEVDIELVLQEGRADLTVADNGPGVDPEHLAHIFEPYFSTDDTGTGLGLPIARKIVQEHGGSIQAANRTPRGLQVVVSLPTVD